MLLGVERCVVLLSQVTKNKIKPFCGVCLSMYCYSVKVFTTNETNPLPYLLHLHCICKPPLGAPEGQFQGGYCLLGDPTVAERVFSEAASLLATRGSNNSNGEYELDPEIADEQHLAVKLRGSRLHRLFRRALARGDHQCVCPDALRLVETTTTTTTTKLAAVCRRRLSSSGTHPKSTAERIDATTIRDLQALNPELIRTGGSLHWLESQSEALQRV